MEISYRKFFELVNSNKSDQESIMIENSRHGTNYEVYDLFYEYPDIYIIAETVKKNEKDNSYDRFVTISNKKRKYQEGNKSSMMFIVSHKAGSLYRTLAIFENYELNLTKIESRKMYDQSFAYMFYVDFEYSKNQHNRIDEILAIFKENTQYLRVIGFYTS